MQIIVVYLIGLVFGLGIMISGMANPAKVINFFDVAGTWDPSLGFVMVGALAVTFIGYWQVFSLPAPILTPRFLLPTKSQIDRRLIAGSALFGVGWGISGFCPGGALPAMGLGRPEVLQFAAAMAAGIFAARLFLKLKQRPVRSILVTSTQAVVPEYNNIPYHVPHRQAIGSDKSS